MAEQPQKPVLQKPPGYRDPSRPIQPGPRPPPRKPAFPPSFTPKKRRRSCCRACCCFLFVFVLVLLLVVAVAFGLFYLWFQPRLPVFHLQSFRIPRFTVTTKADGTYLDAHTVTRVEVKNPNGKLSLFYKQSTVAVTFSAGHDEDTEVGSEDVPEFTQGMTNITSMKVETGVKNQLVDDGEGRKLKARFQNKELVVNVEVRSGVGFYVDGLRIGPLAVKVLCGGVSLKVLETGDMPKCTVTILKWVNIS
ncbi:NDR1/HIN1-like protein 6 [Juglans regia]|uniref:NDR1/HIN1-like protein 6 n=1 Tax=Juglans regia TaxID=51240 RepID=A0A2I4F894_JUGRE|nr:NDR1/HIN1-like protein 6 [Juglans regia]XP_018827870.1 NDR1/HIN1-like protein 6 [Juglans regia]XP_035548311.1 NDR1/HIN1-like protein 6 [Juglans regia]